MNYGRRLNLRAYVMFIVDLFRTYRPPSLTSSTMDITWDPSSVVSFTDLRSSPRVGVEPICLLLTWSFEETSLAWLHLLTLTKLNLLYCGFCQFIVPQPYDAMATILPHCSIPYPLCEHFGIKRDNKTWLHCIKTLASQPFFGRSKSSRHRLNTLSVTN